MDKMATWRHARLYRDGLKICFMLLFTDLTITTADHLSIWTDSERHGDINLSEVHFTAPVSWWDAAAGECGVHGGHLYIPSRDSTLPPEVTRNLRVNTVYWVGALQNSAWVWTGDNSPLYSYMGQSDLPSLRSTHIPGNSAFKCHLHCVEDDITVFGLAGDECYCLSETDNELTIPTDQSAVRCSGNYNEYCGDGIRMSVYELDPIDLVPEEAGQCVYAVEYRNDVVTFEQDINCNSKRYLACHKPIGKPRRCKGDVCTQNKARSWDSSSKKCKLLKVTTANMKSLSSTMAKSSQNRVLTYWVGLRRKYTWRWINGSTVQTSYEKKDDLNTCLTVTRLQGSPTRIRFRWLPCQQEHRSICQTAFDRRNTNIIQNQQIAKPIFQIDNFPNISSPERDLVTIQERNSSHHCDRTTTTSRTQVGNTDDATEQVGTVSTPDTNSSDPMTADMTSQDNTGSYVGVAVGCIIAVGVCVTIVIIMWRKKICCFPMKTHFPKFTSKLNKKPHSDDSPYYSTPASPDGTALPIAVVKPKIDTDNQEGVKSNINKSGDDPYYSTPAPTDIPALPTAVVRPNTHKEDHVYINDPKLSKDIGYNTLSDVSTIKINPNNHAYSHVLAGDDVHRTEASYDIAHSKEHIGDPNEMDTSGKMVTEPALYCVLENAYDVADICHQSSHEGNVADFQGHPELQDPSGRSKGNKGVNNVYNVLDSSKMNANQYRHIGDCISEPDGDKQDMYTLAGQIAGSGDNSSLSREQDTEYLLGASAPLPNNGDDNIYSVAFDSTTA